MWSDEARAKSRETIRKRAAEGKWGWSETTREKARHANTGKMKPGAEAWIKPTMSDIAFAAGFYEGEGTVACSIKQRHSFQVMIGQKNFPILEWMRARFGGRLHHYVQDTNFKRGAKISHWRLTGARARGFIMTIFPFLSTRRQSQALCALGLVDCRLELPDAA